MKIPEINVWALRAPIDQPFCFSQGWVRERAATLVAVIGAISAIDIALWDLCGQAQGCRARTSS